MSKFTLIITVIICLSGCQIPNRMPPIEIGLQHSIHIVADGLQKHMAYPNDVVWIHIYEGDVQEGDKRIGHYRLSTGELETYLPIDGGEEYWFHFFSVESHFGGYSSCNVAVKVNKAISKMVYSTDKDSCTVSKTEFESKKVEVVQGFLGGGVQFSATVKTYQN